MLFLMPNKQCQATENKDEQRTDGMIQKIKKKNKRQRTERKNNITKTAARQLPSTAHGCQ